jgi:Ca2+-binding EF-hand superfamily protein
MTFRLALTRTQIVGFSAVAFALIAGAAIAAPATSNGQKGAGTSTDQQTCPFGRGHMGRGMGPFARFDTDGDGKISLKDLPEKSKSHLATIDTNKDGTLTRDEYEKGREQLRSLREKAMDLNHDGTVTPEEHHAFMTARFAEHFAQDDKNKDGAITADELPKARFERLVLADKNKDGRITKAEIDEALTNGTLGPRDHGKGGHGPRSDAERQAHMQERFNSEDKNHDGFLTQAEIPQRWDHMKTADTNGDNRLSFAEMKAAFETGKMGPPHGRGRGERGHGHRNSQPQ